jgi:hypothetical protein
MNDFSNVINQLPYVGKTSAALQPMVGPGSAVLALILLVLWIILVAWVAKWLWNKSLVPAVSVVRPISSVWTMLGIIVLVMLLFPRQ